MGLNKLYSQDSINCKNFFYLLKFNPVCLLYFVRVISQPTEYFSVQTLTCPCYFLHRFALQWLQYFALLGTNAL